MYVELSIDMTINVKMSGRVCTGPKSNQISNIF